MSRALLASSMLSTAAAALGCTSAADSRAWKLTPTTESPIRGVERANAIAVGDFDGDGRNDFVVLGGDPGELLVLLNKGEGRFEPSAQGVIAAGRGASGMVVGDVDQDGRLDIVVSHHDDFELLVLLGSSSGFLLPAPTSPVVTAASGTPHSHNIAVADMNGDNRPDLVQAQSEEDIVLVLLGDGAGGFSPARSSPFPAGRHPYTIVVADFNGDGAHDFASPNADGEDLTIGLGDGKGGFTAPPGPRVSLEGRALALAAGDLNGDGVFRRSPQILTARGRCYGQAIADLDLDGVSDVAAPSIDAAAVTVWLGQRAGEFSRVMFHTPGTDSQVMALADLNGDDVTDAITAGWDQPTISVLLGQPPSR